MRAFVAFGTVILFVAVAWPVQASAPAARADNVPAGIDVQKVADGVYAAIRREPPGVFVDANSVFVITADGVVVVDANLTPGSARECLAALRKLTDKPVTHVINTHWHFDHTVGNQVYRDAFPAAEFIASERARATFAARCEENRTLYLGEGPKYAAQLREQVQKNTSFFGTPMADDERASYLSAAGLIDRFVLEAKDFRPILPTLTISGELTLHRGGRTIEIRVPGRGHTDTDLVVFLPAEGVLVTGDLVVAPVPLTGDQSFIGDWVHTLDALAALDPAIIVPGHGPVLQGQSYLLQMRELLASIVTQVKAAAARGETLEQTRASVRLTDFRQRFCGGSKALELIFANYVSGAGVAKAYAEATAAK